MAVDSRTVVNALQGVLQTLSQNPYPHVPNPEGCKKRASVSVIIRVRPAFKPIPTANGSVIAIDKPEAPVTSLNHFFSKQWVQEGDPEVLFIKRAGRAGDRWSGHTALPGGKRDPEDGDDLAAAIRETREEIGLDLEGPDCMQTGGLPQRVVTTTWGKEALMVLCPYIFLITSRTLPALQPQPTEVSSVHWVPLRALLSPTLRTHEYVDISSRMAKQGGPIVRKILRSLMGRMMFSAVRLLPAESVYASSVPGFIPETGGDNISSVSGWAQAPYGVPESSQSLAFQQPILLWGLTLGVLADFLDMLPPHTAVKLWKYPTFTTPDLRLLVYLFTRSLRKNNAGDLSSGTWPSNTVVDATTQATAVPGGESKNTVQNNAVGIGGLGVGSSPSHAVGHLLIGYYERINVAIAVFLAYRTILGAGIAVWLYRTWRRRESRNF